MSKKRNHHQGVWGRKMGEERWIISKKIRSSNEVRQNESIKKGGVRRSLKQVKERGQRQELGLKNSFMQKEKMGGEYRR